jgi:hypothetical protein
MITTYIFIVLFFVFKAIADNIKFHWSTSIFSTIKNQKIKTWLNPDNWVHMYKNNDPKQGERFLGSTTCFAFINDGFHLASSFQIWSFVLALTFYPLYVPFTSSLIGSIFIGRIIDAAIYHIIGSTIFEIIYSKVLTK